MSEPLRTSEFTDGQPAAYWRIRGIASAVQWVVVSILLVLILLVITSVFLDGVVGQIASGVSGGAESASWIRNIMNTRL